MKILTGFLTAIALIACSSRDAKREDSTLARDLALANQAEAGQPQFQDTAAASAAPRASTPIDNPPRTRSLPRSEPTQAGAAAAPAASAARQIPSGSSFSLASQQKLCTSTNRPGDRFAATVTGPVVGANGAVIPAGATMVLEIASVSPMSNTENSAMAVRVVSVAFNGMSYPVSGDATVQTPFERTRLTTDPNGDKKKVIGGAIAGALIGQIIGHNTKGTVIGAAAGAATGAVVAKAGEQYEACVPLGASIQVTLNQALVL